MSQKIPLVSNIIPGLMAQSDKVKLDGLYSSTSGLVLNQFSASIIKAHQLTASYLSASSGGIGSFSATTLVVTDLVALNSNLTGTASVPDPLSSSIQRSHQLSSSYFSASSGGAGDFSATTLTVQDLIVINTNMTGGGAVPDPLSSSVQRSHNLSASYFEFISGNINRLTASSLSSTIDISTSKFTASFITASTGTFFIVSSSYGNYNKLTASSLSSTIDVQTSKLTASFLTASTGTFFIASASYLSASGGGVVNFSATTLTVQDLIVINTNMTGAATDPFSASIIRSHNLSASYFEFISGNINRLTASSLSSTIDVQTSKFTASFLTASTGTFFIVSSSYFSASQGKFDNLSASSLSSTVDLQTLKLTASFITASTGTFFIASSSYGSYNKLTASSLSSTVDFQTSKLTASFLTASTGTFFIVSASYAEYNKFTASSLSSTIDVQTSKLTASFATASTGTFFIISSSYSSASQGKFDSLSASSLSSTVDVTTNKLTASFATASTGTFFIVSASYAEYNKFTASSLSSTIDVQTSKLSASFLTASTGTFFIASSSYGSYNKLTASSFSSTIDVQTNKLTASFLTASTGTFFIVSASYAEYNKFTASSLSSTIDIATSKLTASFSTASTGTFFIVSASYAEYNKFTASSLSSTIDVQTSKLTASFATASTGTFFIASASYVSASGGGIINFSATTLTVQDLVVINTNITGGATDPFSASIIRGHNLSASYFEFISGNVNRLTASSLSSTIDIATSKLTASFLTASTGTFFIVSASYAKFDKFTASSLSSTIDVQTSKLTASFATASTGTFFIISSSYASSTYLTIQDLVVINSNITSTIPDPLSSSIQRSHQLSASYFSMSSGSINKLTGTSFSSSIDVQTSKLTASFITASTGTFFIQSSSYASSTFLVVQDLVVINSNLTGTASVPDPLSSSVQRAHNLSASYFEFISGNINRLTGSSISSSIDLQTLKLTATYMTSTDFDTHLLSASYFSMSSGSIMCLTATACFTASTGSMFIVSSSYLTSSQIITPKLLTTWGNYIIAQNRNVFY